MSFPKAKAPFPSLTEIWHTDTYDAINPTRPEVSTEGKVVVVTGGGGGIGAAIAEAFASAGSTKLALLGRRQGLLQKSADAIKAGHPKAKVLILSTDITNEAQVNTAFETIEKNLGPIDVFVSNAGYLSSPSTVSQADPLDWWRAFETNVFGQFLTARAFLKHAAKDAKLISLTSGVSTMPAIGWGNSSYVASKVAAVRLMDFLAQENKEQGVKTFNMHPGIVESEMSLKSGVQALDKIQLPAHFAVWLASKEAEFLNRKNVYCNFDAKEMIQMKDKIANSTLLELELPGVSWDGWTTARIGG